MMVFVVGVVGIQIIVLVEIIQVGVVGVMVGVIIGVGDGLVQVIIIEQCVVYFSLFGCVR